MLHFRSLNLARYLGEVRELGFFLKGQKMSSVQNFSVIPFNPGWLVGIPVLRSTIPYNHQPTRVLNTAQMMSSHVILG